MRSLYCDKSSKGLTPLAQALKCKDLNVVQTLLDAEILRFQDVYKAMCEARDLYADDLCKEIINSVIRESDINKTFSYVQGKSVDSIRKSVSKWSWFGKDINFHWTTSQAEVLYNALCACISEANLGLLIYLVNEFRITPAPPRTVHIDPLLAADRLVINDGPGKIYHENYNNLRYKIHTRGWC